MINSLKIAPANDLHVHFRQDNQDILRKVLPYSVKRCARALVMPNTKIPVTTAEHVKRDFRAIKEHCGYLEPLMTIKIDAEVTPEKVREAKIAGAIAGKIYPEGVTTNSEGGITREMFHKHPKFFEDALGEMESCGMILCLHGEMPGYEVLDREKNFLPWLNKLQHSYPKLKIVLEHITTEEAVYEIMMGNDNLAATITVHHLLLTLDDIIGDKINPHNFCKPVAKFIKDREALLKAAISGNPKFFLGTDSAPHLKENKECSAGCAGVYTSPVMTEVLVDVFDKMGNLDKLENFMTRFGERFYNLLPIEGTILLERGKWQVPDQYDGIVPFMAGRTLEWSIS